MSKRVVLAGVLGLGGLVLALGLLGRQSGPFAAADARVHLEDATAATLDTVSVRGRTVEASVSGVVVQVDADGTAWLSTGGDAFPLRLADGGAVEVEDRLLATGRLRARGGRRWLDVRSYVTVRGDAAPPGAGG